MTVNRIIAHVFLQPSLQQVNEEVMEQLAADHPYFAAAHLLLARKAYQQEGDLQNAAVKKALLYTSQPYHAYQLITKEPVLQEVEDRVAAVIPDDELPPETAVLPTVEDRIAAIVPEDALPEVVIPEEDIPEAVVTEEDIPETVVTEEDIPEAAVEEDIIAIPAPAAKPEPVFVGDFEPSAIHNTTEAEILPPPVITAATDENKAPAGESIAIADESPESSGPIKIFPMAAAEEATELVFQPLFTDDYFAYKRLKTPDEADTLNEQGAAAMKSFTSWLRQMKDNFSGKSNKDWYHQQLHRIYEEEEEPEVSETVEKMAMDSIVFNNDIVSETLAEIWVRQHQYGNAIKIYQKLSLLNPDKNAYFAQKIFELKSLTDKK